MISDIYLIEWMETDLVGLWRQPFLLVFHWRYGSSLLVEWKDVGWMMPVGCIFLQGERVWYFDF